ncbi:MAG: hypothetical protein EU529_01240 [Promethearchaeota archaeon]|nr:MAG: hypothetical protein EU529_01240 [Candidatus Lokiarchaeota archaeon]
MLLYENKKGKLLTFLKIGLNPFKKFVATGEIKENIDLAESRFDLIESIKKIIEKEKNIILPVIGGVGTGKTHLFWTLKNKLHYHNTVYISLENVYRKFYYNIYSEYIEEMGPEILRYITSELCNKWGAFERKFGFFHDPADIDKVNKIAFERLSSPNFEDKNALSDVINAITTHQLDPWKKVEAERWLLGELMDSRELSNINLQYDLRKSSYAYTILKIIIENSKLKSVLFIDDFEKIISLMKPDKESEEIFEPNWLYGDGTSSPEKLAAEKTLDKILNLHTIEGLNIIITLKSVGALEEIKSLVKERDITLLSTFKEPIFLRNFEENDIYDFYKKNLEEFLININYLDFLKEDPNIYFPLNEKILKNIYHKTNGNPREIIKYLIKIFNDIIYSDENLEDIISRYENLAIFQQ